MTQTILISFCLENSENIKCLLHKVDFKTFQQSTFEILLLFSAVILNTAIIILTLLSLNYQNEKYFHDLPSSVPIFRLDWVSLVFLSFVNNYPGDWGVAELTFTV